MTEPAVSYRRQARSFASYRLPNRANRGLMTLAPWLDAMLLVVFFLLTVSPFVLQPGLSIRLPEAPFTGGASPYGLLAVIVVQETADGKPDEEILYFDDARFVLSRPAALEKLRKALADATGEKPGQTMVIEADSRVRHGTLVSFMSMASSAGVPEVVVATRPDGAGEGP